MAGIGGEIERLLGEGFAALNTGRPEEAARACRRILALDRACAQGHFLVGLAASEMKDIKTAASAFGSVTRLDPGHAAAWAQLARVFMRLGQPGRAEKALAEARKAGTADAAVEDLIGVVSSLLGDQRQAKRWYARAASRAPERPAYGVNLASALMFLGENTEAETALCDVLSRHGDIAQAALAAVLAEEGGRPNARRRADGESGPRGRRAVESLLRLRRRQGIRGLRGMGRGVRPPSTPGRAPSARSSSMTKPPKKRCSGR